MISVNRVPAFLDGYEEANELLHDVYAGVVLVEEAQRWIAELEREGLGKLAAEISVRLPLRH